MLSECLMPQQISPLFSAMLYIDLDALEHEAIHHPNIGIGTMDTNTDPCDVLH